jgi:hypothetical protein
MCLQEHLDHIAWDEDCSYVKASAFDSHPGCYIRSGICFLPPTDWKLILDTIDIQDINLRQAIITGVSCIGNWVPMAFPIHSLSAGGGYRGLMERDQQRILNQMQGSERE